MSGKSSSVKAKTLLGNILYAFSVQGVSLILSLMMSLIVPKFMGTEEFGYWQLFIFYTGYVGFFHFGLNDGLYLRNGGLDYHEMDFSIICAQFWASIVGQSVMGLAFAAYGVFGVTDSKKSYIFVMTAIYLVVVNAASFLGYILQASNRVKAFSTSVLIDKAFFLIAAFGLIMGQQADFRVYVLLYLFSKVICLVYSLIAARKAAFTRPCAMQRLFQEMWINITIGINLMLSNIASMLILGSGRFIVEQIWGVEAFGKFSLSISLTNFFLQFIAQVSMVLFPALRRIEEAHLKEIYTAARSILGIALAAVFLFYMPVKFVLNRWLPQYDESLTYLALLLPICTFDGKMNMLCSTYLKVIRKERILLLINVASFLLSLVLCLFSGYVLHNIYAILLSMVIAIAFRSTIADVYLSKKMGIRVWKDILGECLLAAAFVGCTWMLGAKWGFAIYAVCYAVYLLIYRKTVIDMIRRAKHLFMKKKTS